jgi:O-Antigen ligase
MSQTPGYRLPARSSKSVKGNDHSLFNGLLLRWSAITSVERLVCGLIVATPVWWMVGWGYALPLFAFSVIVYELAFGDGMQLQRPGMLPLASASYQVYRIASAVLNSNEFAMNSITGLANGLSFSFFLWYFENRKIKVRPAVIAWAMSVLTLYMLGFWLVAQGILGAHRFQPPRTLLGQILDKGERFIPGAGTSNYLLPYWAEDKLPGGLARFCFFFPVPEDLGLVAGFICLQALELKKNAKSYALFGAGVFLLFLSGTRSNWLVLPMILGLRFLIVAGKAGGPALILALISMVSIVGLSMPLVTGRIVDTVNQTTEATGSFRRDSTEVRNKIYQRTFAAVVDEPDYLFLGRGVTGPTVLPGYEPAKIGSHSFILGTLIYRGGIVGSALFLWFWVAMLRSLYRTRFSRPLLCLILPIYMSLTFFVMEISVINYLLLLISFLEYRCIEPEQKKFPRKSYA